MTDHNLGRLIADMGLLECDRCHTTECETPVVLAQHGWKVHKYPVGELVFCKDCEPQAFPPEQWFNFRPEAA